MKQILFILGLPRSGTTLLQRVINTSPEVATASEPWIFLPFLGMREPKHQKAVYGARQAIIAMNSFIGEDQVFDDNLAATLRAYIAQRFPKCRYFCEKTPRNLLYGRKLMNWFPEDRFIILNRNPLNVAVSIFSTFEKGTLNPYKFKVDLELGLQELVLLNQNPGSALVLRYEDLVKSPDRILSRCSEYLELSTALDPQEKLTPLEGPMGDPTGQYKTDRIIAQPGKSYLRFIDSVYRKYWFLSFLKRIGPGNFSTLGYDYQDHLDTIQRLKVYKPIGLKDLYCLIGRSILEFATFRVLPRRPEEKPDFILY